MKLTQILFEAVSGIPIKILIKDPEMADEFAEIIEAGLKTLGVHLDPDVRERFQKIAKEFRDWSGKLMARHYAEIPARVRPLAKSPYR